jgi:conjugative relaxase-like TrwC/TraI family protein
MVRFDRACQGVKGAVAYFREHMLVGDYLGEDGQREMTWTGQGAARLGLVGACRLEDFARVCAGRHPGTGDRLTVRAKAARRACFFGQISAPKDVSVAWLVGGDERIAGWWADAVTETLAEMERCMATRVRRDGGNADRTTGEMIAATVTHDTSRALDPQLHTHVCVMNATFDAVESRWKGVQPAELYRQQAYFREVCYNHLARALIGGGYDLESAPQGGFRLRGVPAELRERFSKRRREILATAGDGPRDQNALQAIAGRTRAAKVKRTADELRTAWRQEAGEHLEALTSLVRGARLAKITPPRSAAESAALASACSHHFERHSVATERELLREALTAARGRVTVRALRAELEATVQAGALVRHRETVVSPATLADENECIRIAREGRDSCGPVGAPPERQSLSDDQFAAAVQLGASRDRVMVLQGDAGTGKTTALRVIAQAANHRGLTVFGCAPSSGATEILRRELTPWAETLQQLLVSESLQRNVRGALVIVDEAGLISVRQMRELCRLTEKQNCRLLLVGDTKQHASVEAGDALRAICRYAGLEAARLTRIRRQRDPRYRAAVAALARGDTATAFKRLDELGAVHAIASSELPAAAARAYMESISAGRSCLAIAPVWSEIHAFTAELRPLLRAAGRLAAEERTVEVVDSRHLTREQMRRLDSYAAGDVLSFHRSVAGFAPGALAIVHETGPRGLLVTSPGQRGRWIQPEFLHSLDVGRVRTIAVAVGERLLLRANCVTAGLRNGELVEVKTLHPDGSVGLVDGRTLPSTFRHFTHGYASTSHAAQGKTVDHGILLLGPDGLKAANLQQAYVSNSRFRERQLIFTSDKAAAWEAMSRSNDRPLALEVLPDWEQTNDSTGRGTAVQPRLRAPRLATGT